jgi:chemotaxis protein CheX
LTEQICHVAQIPRTVAEWRVRIEAAANDVFSLMVGTKLEPALNCGPRAPGGLLAMVGLAGVPCGVFSVRCDTTTASEIANKMLGTPGASQSLEELSDGLGEICNMIAGSLKSRLPGEGANCLMSVPTVVHGADYQMRSVTQDLSAELAMLHEKSEILFRLDLQHDAKPSPN